MVKSCYVKQNKQNTHFLYPLQNCMQGWEFGFRVVANSFKYAGAGKEKWEAFEQRREMGKPEKSMLSVQKQNPTRTGKSI